MKAAKALISNELTGQEHGFKGPKRRKEFKAGHEAVKLGAMLQQARYAKGPTQVQPAKLAGTAES